MEQNDKYSGLEIAIIGMSCRFPDADNVEQFWSNLKQGRESIRFYSEEELLNLGVPKAELEDANFVKTNGSKIENAFCFDPSFFGYSPIESEMMSPQSRIMHECVWNALEDAGCSSDNNNAIGLYAGMSSTNFWETLVQLGLDKYNINPLLALSLSNKDSVATNISYRLNLNGPSITVQSACSTSLVATHMACQGLLAGDCDVAIAGGATVTMNQKAGYKYTEGMIASRDGHIRAFDKNASGTVGGEGAGAVVLKRLEDALHDGDNIHCIIRATAVNNDGNRKVGYTAPSVEGQINVIKKAISFSGISAEDIGFIEAHGSGTELGDVVEVAALSQAFNTKSKNYCALGSVKTNIGHLDAAAGMAGLIKAALSIKNKQIVPSLNYNKPNPKICIEDTPFYVNTELKNWNAPNLIAGVSSLGIGGTNAHVIIEEAPQVTSLKSLRHKQILLISAESEDSLNKIASDLRDFLSNNKGINIDDVAYTLAAGRKGLPYRGMVVCDNNVEDSIKKVNSLLENKTYTQKQPLKTTFVFSGVSSMYKGMGKDLYDEEPIFSKEIDYCSELIFQKSSIDVKNILLSDKVEYNAIHEFEVGQFLTLAFEYALAKLLMAWGIKPDFVMGNSLGEYVAAFIAGVFKLDDLIDVLVFRSKLLNRLPKGKMISVNQPYKCFEKNLEAQVFLAVDNGDSCILSGDKTEIEKVKQFFANSGIATKDIEINFAIHSNKVESICNDFENSLKNIKLDYPRIEFVSNVTGDIIDSSELINPTYWSRQLKSTVHFANGIKKIISHDTRNIFIEIGPSNDSTLTISKLIENHKGNYVTQLFGGAKSHISPKEYFRHKIGLIWQWGADVNWEKYYNQEKRIKVSLPVYPFKKEPFKKVLNDYKEANYQQELFSENSKVKINDWLYCVSWNKKTIKNACKEFENSKKIILFIEDRILIKELRKYYGSRSLKFVLLGSKFNVSQDLIELDYNDESSYKSLFELFNTNSFIPDGIVFISDHAQKKQNAYFHKNKFAAFISHLYIARNLNRTFPNNQMNWLTISNNVHNVIGNETINLTNSFLLGIGKVIPQEYRNLSFQFVDGDGEINIHIKRFLARLNTQNESGQIHPLTVYRNNHQWIPQYNPMVLNEKHAEYNTFIEKGGTYIIIGGLGDICHELAEMLSTFDINLVLIGLSKIDQTTDKISNEVRDSRYHKIKSNGNVRYYSVDITNLEKTELVFKEIEREHGSINGIYYAAGASTNESICSIDDFDIENIQKQFGAKVTGIQVVHELITKRNISFCIVFSSLSSILGGLGMASYSAANNFIDNFVSKKNTDSKCRWISLNWDGAEGEYRKDIFNLLLNNDLPEQVIFSIKEKLRDRIQNWVNFSESVKIKNIDNAKERPELETKYATSEDKIQSALVKIWEQFLSIDNIGINDSFYDLGGDSLLAVNIIPVINKKLNTNLSIKDFLQYENIHEISKLIQNSEESENYELKKIQPTYINKGKNQILALYHPPTGSKKKKTGIIMCNPFGQEQIRSHRTYLAIANKMANKGFPTLRFDFLGCGDSFGDLDKVTLEDWIQNINDGINFIQNKESINEICMFGARLGASLALSFASSFEIQKIIAWNPVIYGDDYIKEQKKEQRKWLHGSFAKAKRTRGIELFGFQIPKPLLKEIESINLSNTTLVNTNEILFIDNPENKGGKEFVSICNKQNINIELIEKNNTEFWVKNYEGTKNYIYPEQEVTKIIKWLEKMY